MMRIEIGPYLAGLARRWKISLRPETSPEFPTRARSRRYFVGKLLIWVLIGAFAAKADGKLDGIVLVIADGTSLELITAARLFSGRGRSACLGGICAHGFCADFVQL